MEAMLGFGKPHSLHRKVFTQKGIPLLAKMSSMTLGILVHSAS